MPGTTSVGDACHHRSPELLSAPTQRTEMRSMIPTSESEARRTNARRLRRQATACSRLGSPLYADLLERTAQDVGAGGAS